MAVIHPDYAKVRKALAAGRQLTAEDVADLTGRTRLQAQTLLNNLKTTLLVEPYGKRGRMTIYVRTARLLELEGGAPRAGAARGPQEAERQLDAMDESLRLLLRAFRIGPAPKGVPGHVPRNVKGKAGMSADAEEAGA